MPDAKYLLDVNILFALATTMHTHHTKVLEWLDTPNLDFGVCVLSEAGFVRLAINPAVDPVTLTVYEASEFLHSLAIRPGCRFWPISIEWSDLAGPFLAQIQGHNQVTDACLLGLAVQENGVLVTTDKRLKVLAGRQYSQNLLVID